jgi:hypothetical protein
VSNLLIVISHDYLLDLTHKVLCQSHATVQAVAVAFRCLDSGQAPTS